MPCIFKRNLVHSSILMLKNMKMTQITSRNACSVRTNTFIDKRSFESVKVFLQTPIRRLGYSLMCIFFQDFLIFLLFFCDFFFNFSKKIAKIPFLSGGLSRESNDHLQRITKSKREY